MLTQGDRFGEASLFDEVKKYLKEKYKKPGQVFLGLVHRLDKPVQGIVLFGKTSKGASRLSEQFREHTIKKTYHAIVAGKMEQSRGEIKEKVNKISFFAEGFTEKTDEELLRELKKATKTRTAELSWEVVRRAKLITGGECTLLKIMPKTGRFHQIRIQLSNMGHPILGDFKYGFKGEWQDKNKIALAATGIEFKTATLGRSQTGEAENKTVKLELELSTALPIDLIS